MPLLIVRNNIADMNADAIVNTANPLPVVGSGVDRAIYTKAGWKELLELRQAIGKIEVGNVAVTPALDLDAKFIIHAVGPRWKGGDKNEVALLEKCYANILKTATKNKCKSVAIPLISTGNYDFPKNLALKIANEVITNYLKNHDLLVYLVVFDKKSYEVSAETFAFVKSYIDENYVEEIWKKEYSPNRFYNRTDSSAMYEAVVEKIQPPTCAEEVLACKRIATIEDIVEKLERSFTEELFARIDEKGLTDPQVYKRANLDRKLFSKIRNNKNYKPSKNTALALAVALELNLDETKDFIGKAGFALTHSSKMDIIVEYFILNGEYDIFKINEVLFAFDQPLLGVNVA